jgi:AcrR family transcriptional regulator
MRRVDIFYSSQYIEPMARPTGSRNADYEARRAELALAASRALVDADGHPTSLAHIARAVGVSVPTLRHYFDDHDGVVAAAFEAVRDDGHVHIAALKDPGPLDLAASVAEFVCELERGWSFGLGAVFATGLTHGLRHEVRGPAMLDFLVEPTLQALEARLAVHAARGELRADADLRAAALALFAPAFVSRLHQHELGGRSCRPLDQSAFDDTHLDAWLRGWRA